MKKITLLIKSDSATRIFIPSEYIYFMTQTKKNRSNTLKNMPYVFEALI